MYLGSPQQPVWITRIQKACYVASGIVLLLFSNGITLAGSDNFDSYDTSGGQVDLMGTGNGEFFYLSPPPQGTGMQPSHTFAAVANGTAPSAPNVLEMTDTATDFSAGAQLQSAFAVDLRDPMSQAQIAFDFKTTAGPNNRVSMSVRPLYSINSFGTAQDSISNNHNSGLGDNGLYFLNSGGMLGGLANHYTGNTWYHYKLDILRPTGSGGTFDYTLDVTRMSDNFSLGQIAYTGANDAGRDWLTGVGFYLSSNPNETILIDNLTIGLPPIETDTKREWAIANSGMWDVQSNWNPQLVPNSNETPVLFGNMINQNETVVTNETVTASSIQFDNSNSYFIAGGGMVLLDGNTGLSQIEVDQGSHQFTLDVGFDTDATVDVALNSQLTFQNELRFNGHTLNKTGNGQLDINHIPNSGTGDLLIQQGTIGGVGTVSANINNEGGMVAPGVGTGRLAGTGNYNQQSGGTLEIEIGGTTPLAEFDSLNVPGTATLDGTLTVSLVDLGTGLFDPIAGNSFTILSADSGRSGTFSVEQLPLLSGDLTWNLQYLPTSVVLAVSGGEIPGDYNGNNMVDAADYSVWRDTLASLSDLRADGNNNGVIDQGDYEVWKSNFGSSLASNTNLSVPEPTGLWIGFFGTLLAFLSGYGRLRDLPRRRS